MSDAIDPEIAAIGRCVRALDTLDTQTRERVMRYLNERYRDTTIDVLRRINMEMDTMLSEAKTLPEGALSEAFRAKENHE